MPHFTKMDRAFALASKGPIRARDLRAIGVPTSYLARLCSTGALERVGRGLYEGAPAPVSALHDLAAAQKRVPHARICLLSALAVHGARKHREEPVWLMIETHARKPQLDAPQIEVVRAGGVALTQFVDRHLIDGVWVSVTNPAKTVADCFRYRSHIGLAAARHALRWYLGRARTPAQRHKALLALKHAAIADGVSSVVAPYVHREEQHERR